MTTNSSEQQKIKTFEERFLGAVAILLDRWKNEYDLALAMGDDDTASKEKIKIDAMHHIQQLCEEASRETTLDAAVKAFGSRIKEVKDVLRERLEEAKAVGDKAKEINFRIELGIYDGPVNGFLWRTLKDMGEDVPKYQEFMNREH